MSTVVFYSYRVLTALSAVAFILIGVRSLQAQESFDRQRGSARIDVSGTVQPAGANLMVELRGGVGIPYRGEVDANGSFHLDNVPEGDYEVRVTDLYGNLIYNTFASVTEAMGPLAIRLPETRREQPISGVISVERLQHKVPGKARKEFETAERAFQKKDVQRSIEHLKKAVEIDPEYMEAYNNLGSRYLSANQPAQALEQFRRAAEIDPHSSIPPANIAVSFILLQKFADGEQAARRALDLDPSNMRARFLLAVCLTEQHKGAPEAIDNLRRASDQWPGARLLLAQTLAAQGQIKPAADELKAYLATGRPEHRAEVKEALAKLDAAPEQARAAAAAGTSK